MIRQYIYAVTVGLGISFVGTSVDAQTSTSKNGQWMTGEELTSLLGDGELLGLGGKGTDYKGQAKFNANGTASGSVTFTNGDVFSFRGTWEVRGNQLCRVWVGDEGEVCEKWKRTGKKSSDVYAAGDKLGRNYWN